MLDEVCRGDSYALISTPSLLAQEASGADMPALDSGNTAWILTSSILVLLMSIPGIALFYGGLVRQKNVLSVIMQTLFIVGVGQHLMDSLRV